MSLSSKEIIAHLVAVYGNLDTALEDGYGEGICCNCGYIQEDIEPDAVAYECEACGEEEVYSIENVITKQI